MADASPDTSRLRHRKAQIEQRHLQFGRHCPLDVGGLLGAADRVQVAQPGRSPSTLQTVAIKLTDRSTHGSLSQSPGHSDASHVLARPNFETVVTRVPTADCRNAPGPAILGGFVSRNEVGAPSSGEWVATLADHTSVIIDDLGGKPNPVGIEKAVSIVQSRSYLEQRARRLLMPFAKADSVRLVTLNFAREARQYGSEFLMCFAVQDARGAVSSTSPVVKVGFSLPGPVAVDPVFALSVVAAFGFW